MSKLYILYLIVNLNILFISVKCSENKAAKAEIQSCSGCQLSGLPEVKAFIFEDVPKYNDVVFKSIHGAPPELVLFSDTYKMMENHCDLSYFKNKEIPSSSDEDNPHLLSEDSEEEKLYKKPFTYIIRDVGTEFYDFENREENLRSLKKKDKIGVSFFNEPKTRPQSKKTEVNMAKSSHARQSDTKPKENIHERKKVSVSDTGKRKSLSLKAISFKKGTVQQAEEKEAELEELRREDKFLIENKTFLGLRKVYSTTETIAPPITSPSQLVVEKPTKKKITVEVVHIVPITLSVEVQRELKCESGIDILLEQPWGIILKEDVLRVLLMETPSPLNEYSESLQAYPEEEILIGRSSEINPGEFVIAITLHGRAVLLEELKNKHTEYIDAIVKSTSLPTRPWDSLGSEEEINETHVVNKRPFISYDCAVKREAHEERLKEYFNYSEFYTEMTNAPRSHIEMVKTLIMDKSVQATPGFNDVLIQTTPEIPVNSNTQFSIEMRVKENEEVLLNMGLDEEFLNEKLMSLLQKVEPHLTYNEDFDLYQDDYKILSEASEFPSIYPTLPYEYLSTMFTFLGTQNKGISGSSWHPSLPGVLAVSYAHNTIGMIDDMEGNSDDENYMEGDSDDEALYGSISTRSPFDFILEKVWNSQIEAFEKQKEKPRDKTLYRLATTSLKFMKYARDMRLFQMVQAKKQFLNMEDFADLNQEEVFEYPLFEGVKKKYEHKDDLDIDEVLLRKSAFLKRDYLFSDTFKWKMKGAESVAPIYMMIKEHKKLPKKYIRTFLFREIWSGDQWNFGPDLELKAIDINREPGIFALGMPLIPKHKTFLPGFTKNESKDPTKTIPWKALEGRSESNSSLFLEEPEDESEEEEYMPAGIFEHSPKCDIQLISLNFERNKENLEDGSKKELTEISGSGDGPQPKIIHVSDAYLSNVPWAFNAETQDYLLNEIKDIATCKSKELFKSDIEVLSEGSDEDYFEKDDDVDDLEKLQLQHYAIVWTINDMLKPLHRLSCPFEITALSFCPYNGNYIAGGTLTGQVVLWEVHDWSPNHIHSIRITDPEDEEGFRHLRKLMCWFKRLTKVAHIPATSMSSKKTSHNDRVIDITWLPPNIQVTPTEGKLYKVVEPEEKESMETLEFMSTSADGTLLFWSLKDPPSPQLKASFSVSSIHRGQNFPVPTALKKVPPRFAELYLRWEPRLKVILTIPQSKVSALRYHITCISHYDVPHKYELDTHPEEREQKDVSYHYQCLEDSPSMKSEAIIGTIDGTIALVGWPHTGEDGQPLKIPPEGLSTKVIRTFNYIHDGPITKISRNPKNKNLFLSAGGHIFALWIINRAEPLKWKKYSDQVVTFVGWTNFGASTFRVGFSNGTFEIWNITEDGNNAMMSLPVGQGSICDLSVPTLPTPQGLVAIVDQKGLLKFYNVPKEYQVVNQDEDEKFFSKIETERNRKAMMSELSEKGRKEILKGKEKKTVKKKDTEDDESEEEEVIADDEEKEVKVKEIIGCKKYKEEMYKWYLRRRGQAAGWLDPAEKQWYKQEEDHMIQTILKNKKISMETLEEALVPLKEKEKHEAKLAVKKEEIIIMADNIFNVAVQDLQKTREEAYKTKEIEDIKPSENMEAVMEKMNEYFGESYEQKEDELENWVQLQKIDKLSFEEILQRNQKVRDFWNDRRRYLNKDQRWLREQIKEELEKEGLKFSYWVDHEESYKFKKYKRRLDMIDKLKKIYGNDYDPFWDLEDDGQPSRREIPDSEIHVKDLIAKLLVILETLDPSVKELKKKLSRASEKDLQDIDIETLRKMVKYYLNFAQEGGIRISSTKHRAFLEAINKSVAPEEGRNIQIKIPEGSFYRKYTKDTQQKWIKPKRTEEIFRTPAFKFKYGDIYPQPSDEQIAKPRVICEDLSKQVKVPEQKGKEEEEEDIFPDEEEIESKTEGEKTGPLRESKATEGEEAQSKEDKSSELEGEEEKIEDSDEQEASSDKGVEGEVQYKEELVRGDPVPQEASKEEPTEEEKMKDNLSKVDVESKIFKRKSTVTFEKDDAKQQISDLAEVGEKDQEEETRTNEDDEASSEKGNEEGEGVSLSEEMKRQMNIQTIYELIDERKEKGEEILNLEDLSSYESIESLDSVSSMADSPDQSISSEDWVPQQEVYLEDTEKDLKEYFEGPPPRYEPPRRRPYFRAPHEDEPTEEWTSDEKNPTEDFGKSYLGIKPDKPE